MGWCYKQNTKRRNRFGEQSVRNRHSESRKHVSMSTKMQLSVNAHIEVIIVDLKVFSFSKHLNKR